MTGFFILIWNQRIYSFFLIRNLWNELVVLLSGSKSIFYAITIVFLFDLESLYNILLTSHSYIIDFFFSLKFTIDAN